MQQNMLSPQQFMVPQPSDPTMLMAHQQAMMYAKQAYQMAVAQQAIAAAGEEWERGSSMGFGGGSVYGGGSSGSMLNGMGGQGWSGSSMIFPSQSRVSMFSGAQSEYGGPTSGGMGNWGSGQSTLGDNAAERARRMSGMTGMPQTRQSGMFPAPPPIPSSKGNSSAQSRGNNNRPRTISQPAAVQQNRGPVPRRTAAPPSSWKANNS
jgi:serine/arginine repetitive matrix protein 2